MSRPGAVPGSGERARFLVATRSEHKLKEIRELLGDLPLVFVSLDELGVEELPEEAKIEVHETFAENARAKADHFRHRTGLPTMADDSGLCVDALEGGPGVRTKRFAPPEMVRTHGRTAANNLHLLERLSGVPETERGACYRCALAVVTGDDEGSTVVEGEVCGRIATEPRGEGGFGYDPLFFLPEHGGTYAELPERVKRETSHRARAVRALRPWLEAWSARAAS